MHCICLSSVNALSYLKFYWRLLYIETLNDFLKNDCHRIILQSNQRWKKLDLILGWEIIVLFLRATQFLMSVKILPQKNEKEGA